MVTFRAALRHAAMINVPLWRVIEIAEQSETAAEFLTAIQKGHNMTIEPHNAITATGDAIS